MTNLYRCVLPLFLITAMLSAQPEQLGTDITGTYVENALTDRGVTRYVRILVGANKSNAEWNFHLTSGYATNWRPYTANQKLVIFNTKIDPSTEAASARYNSGSGGQPGRIDVTVNKYYTWVIGENSASNNFFSVLQTDYTPTSITSVSTPGTVYSGQTHTVTVTMASALSSEEKLFVRYSVDGFTTSNFVEITSLNESFQGTAVIPAQTAGKTVEYYALTTPGLTPTHIDADYQSLNIRTATGENVGGTNFSYTTIAWTTAQNGNWFDAATWAAGSVPPNDNATSVVVAHTITLNSNITLNSLVVNSGASVVTNASVSTITFSANATVTNNGTLNLAAGGTPNITFAGTGTINGSGDVDFAYVLVYGGVDFGAHSNIVYGLDLYSGGYVNTNPPTYLTDAYLGYTSGGVYNRGVEWKGTSGPGYPNWVYIYGGTMVNLKYTADPDPETDYLTIENGTLSMGDMTGTLTVKNDLQIDASGTLSLSTAAGGDIIVKKGWTNNGTFTSNGRRVTFSGTAFQQVNNGGSGNFDFVSIDNANDVRLASGAMTINNELKFVNGKFRLNAPLEVSSGGTIQDYTSSKFIVVGSSITVKQTVPGTNTDIVFPIGMNTSQYTPVTLNNNGGTADIYSVAMDGANEFVVDGDGVVTNQWIINESVDGGSNVIVTMQWNADEQGSGFVQNNASIGRYNGSGSSWTLFPTTVISSTAPFISKNVSPLTGTGIFQNSKYKIGNSSALPVELTMLRASFVRSAVKLEWRTAMELDNSGFEIERKQDARWQTIGFVEGSGTTNAPREYQFYDKGLSPGKYLYRLKQINKDGTFERSGEVEAIVVLSAESYALSQNFPNPFNPSTTFTYAVKERQHVTVRVFDGIGREVATLVDDVVEPNMLHSVNFDGSTLASGIYFYSLQTPGRHEIRKLMLMK